MAGDNAELITENMAAALTFDDTNLYFTTGAYGTQESPEDFHTLYCMSKENPGEIEELATLSDRRIGGIYTVLGYDNLIVEASRMETNDEETIYIGELYLVAKDGSSVERLELP